MFHIYLKRIKVQIVTRRSREPTAFRLGAIRLFANDIKIVHFLQTSFVLCRF